MDKILKLNSLMRSVHAECFFINHEQDRRYFSGFTGSNGYLLITSEENILITDQRYTQQAQEEAPHFTVVTHGLNPYVTIQDELQRLAVQRVAYDAKSITDYQLTQLKEQTHVQWLATVDYGLQLRTIKTADEVKKIQKSVAIADEAMQRIASFVRPGMTERAVANELEYLLRALGSEGSAFGTIVASGPRSALPHATVTDRVIEQNEFLLLDFGAKYQGYMSDITRTIWIGEPPPSLIKVYDLVLEALERAIDTIRPGISCHQVDKAARDIFVAAQLEQFSLRGLGHGVGLQIHELPRVVMNGEQILEEGMVFTVEPGLYLPEIGGVRIEDIVLVTSNGCEILTQTPRLLNIDA